MATIECEIEEITLTGTYASREVPSVKATCTECQHETESYGQGEKSIARCLALLREECPCGEENFYIAE